MKGTTHEFEGIFIKFSSSFLALRVILRVELDQVGLMHNIGNVSLTYLVTLLPEPSGYSPISLTSTGTVVVASVVVVVCNQNTHLRLVYRFLQ